MKNRKWIIGIICIVMVIGIYHNTYAINWSAMFDPFNIGIGINTIISDIIRANDPANNQPINLWQQLLNLVAKVLPKSNGFPEGITNAFLTLFSYAKQLSFVIPFNTIWICLGIILSFDMINLISKFTKWLIERIH